MLNLTSEKIKILYDLLSLNYKNDSLRYRLDKSDLENLISKIMVMDSYDNATAGNYSFDDSSLDCGMTFRDLAQLYGHEYHPQLAILVCVFGTVANILNIIVLTREEMACAPINRILTALAVADMLVMIEYIPYTYYYYMVLLKTYEFPYPGAVFMLFHANVTQILHTTSICLTLTLAIWRYLAIGYPDKNYILCSDQRCTLAIVLSYFLPIVLCAPIYFTTTITEQVIIENNKTFILYHLDLTETCKRDKTLLKINFWIYGVFIKLLPCCILTIISFWLIRTLFKAKKRKQVLRAYDAHSALLTNNKETTSATNTVNERNNKKNYSKAERRADRTTKMLIAVLLLFLVTEFPQGIFALLIGFKGKDFLKCYQFYGELMDILALINCAINFILYCCMNRMFRMTFRRLFKPKILAQWTPSTASELRRTSIGNGTNTTDL